MHPQAVRHHIIRYSFLVVCVLGLYACMHPTAIAPTRTPTLTHTTTATPEAAASATTQPRTATPTTTTSLPATPTLTALDRNMRERLFETVWSTIADHYVYRDFRGVDWQATYDIYKPKALAATSPQQFYGVIREMIQLLNDDHSRLDDPQQVARNTAVHNGRAEYAGIGIMIRELRTGLMITRIAQGGPAEQAGLRPNDIITVVDGTPITSTYELADGDYGSIIRGPVGSTVSIEYIRGAGTPQRVIVTRAVIPGDAFPEAVAERLADNLILLTIDTFDRDQLASIVREALVGAQGTAPVDGLIIDIRENGGGSIEDMLAVIALFHDGGSIGSQIDRNNSYQLNVPQRRIVAPFDTVPIILLTSTNTASAAEMFSAGMRHLRNAQIIGETTAGNSENMFPYDLEDGSVLWVAELLYQRPDGTYIEDVGVIPDITLQNAGDERDMLADPFVVAAREQLTQRTTTP
ncbi:MAG: S41 family peptidase [Roseiflexaceae bacterium]|jgi:carboxyl-terminal processing protease